MLGSENRPSTCQGAGLNIGYDSPKRVFGFPAASIYTETCVDKYTNRDESHTYRQYFLPTATTYGRTLQDIRDETFSIQSREDFRYIPMSLSGHLFLSYVQKEENALSSTTQWDDTSETARQSAVSRTKSKQYNVSLWQFGFTLPFAKMLDWELRAWWNRWESDAFDRRTSQAGQTLDDYRHDYGASRKTSFYVEPGVSYRLPKWGKWRLTASERFKASGQTDKRNLFALSELDGWKAADSVALTLTPSGRDLLWQAYDPVNSYYSKLRRQENEAALSLTLDKNKVLPFEVTLTFPLYAQHERLVYRRDALDTVARRDMVALNPSLRLKHKAWSFTASWTTTTPDLQQQMRYRDTRNPLYITEGNPSLRNTQKLDASMRWSPKKDQHISSSFVYYRRSVAQGFTYNPLTSAYTYRPENVRGNWTWNTSADLSVALDKKQQWWLESHTEENTWHSVDYTAVSGMNDAQLNRVETVNLGERLRMRYMNKHTKVGITGNVGWRRTWGHRPSQESISAVDFNYGMTLEHTLATWKTTFNVDAGVYSRRGYSSHAMNKDDCLVNASVSQPLFHGRLTLKLEGHDLLYQLTNTSYEVNAQGRTEAWHRVIPNYVMLHAIYNFSRTPRH